MHYVYDFDSTLFATQKIWDDWRGMLLSAGLSETLVDQSYQAILPTGYSPRKHAHALGIATDQLEDMVSRFGQLLVDESQSLLFDDVAPFIEAKRAGHRQTILTQGDEAHQWEKMRASGIDRMVPRVVITSPDGAKIERLADMIDEDATPITFIDDNPHHLVPAHQSGLPITLIRMRRPAETLAIAPHPLDNVAWRVIASLDELGE